MAVAVVRRAQEHLVAVVRRAQEQLVAAVPREQVIVAVRQGAVPGGDSR